MLARQILGPMITVCIEPIVERFFQVGDEYVDVDTAFGPLDQADFFRPLIGSVAIGAVSADQSVA